jgi:hypothetical protein
MKKGGFMEKNIVLLDFDGVILTSEEKVVLAKKNSCISKWDDFFSTVDWFEILNESEEINDSLKILKELERRKRNIIILTKIHTLLEAEAKTKYMNNQNIKIPIMFVPPHVKKSDVYFPKEKEILVDDNSKNIEEWNSVGGTGILFSQNEEENKSRVKSLKFLLK